MTQKHTNVTVTVCCYLSVREAEKDCLRSSVENITVNPRFEDFNIVVPGNTHCH